MKIGTPLLVLNLDAREATGLREKTRLARVSRPPGTRQPAIRNRTAFTLTEVLVVMALLTVIILGLMATFTQTQRAFRLGMMQTDVLESGRLATDMISRELQQVTPSYVDVNLPSLSPGFYSQLMDSQNTSWQALVGGNVPRTNVLEDMFFLNRENQTWTGLGYFVRTNDTFPLNSGFGPVGTLYRFETNNHVFTFNQNPSGLWAGFLAARSGANFSSGVSKLMDGIMHFRVRAFDTNGVEIVGFPPLYRYGPGIVAQPIAGVPDTVKYTFGSNAVPAFVELEIGILEPQALERYRSIPNANVRDEFLRNQAGHLHLFRQRVAIRNVEPGAYQ